MASRRMRIKAMANIPSLNRGRAGVTGSDSERPTTPNSPAGSFTSVGSPAFTCGEILPYSISDSGFDSFVGKRSSISTTLNKEIQLSDQGGVPNLEEVSFVALSSPKRKRILSPSLRHEPYSSVNKSININNTVPRPPPSHSPFKTIVMSTHGSERRSPVHIQSSRNQTQSPMHSPPYNPHYQRRETPSPLFSPKNPIVSDYTRVRRPDSPFRSPSQYSRESLFSPPSNSTLASTTLSLSCHDSDFYASTDQTRRACSPANTSNFGANSSLMQKEIGLGNMANNVPSSETLRQRLQKGTSLNTSKYATTRKEFLVKYMDKKPDVSELTILHYTFWNPPNERKGEKTGLDEDEEENLYIGESSDYANPFGILTDPNNAFKDKGKVSSEFHEIESSSNTTEDMTPTVGPRVKVGPNGELIIDEQSLVVETSESQRAKKHLEEIETVSGSGYEVGSSGFYRHKRNPKRGGDWSHKETVKFYRALNMCGTDFSMMTHLFPRRTRAEIKAKFKREDRRNPAQISQALACQTFDPMDKMTSSENEEEVEFCIPVKKSRSRAVPRKRTDHKNLAEFQLSLDPEPTLPETAPGNKKVDTDLQNVNQVISKPVAQKDKIINKKHSISETTEIPVDQTKYVISDGFPTVLPSSLEQTQRDDSFTSTAGPSVQEFVFNNERVQLIVPVALRKSLNDKITTTQIEDPTNEDEWTPPLQPEYGNPVIKPKLKRGRPRRVFDRNVERLPKPKSQLLISPKMNNHVKSGSSVQKQSDESIYESISNSVLIVTDSISNNMGTISEPSFIEPDILRFDSTDLLGFKIISNATQYLEANDSEIVLDAPNCGTIPHQIFEIQSIINTCNSQSLSLVDDQSVSTISGTKVNLAETEKDKNNRTHKRSSKVKPIPRPPRYRVPGPGGKANIKSSGIVVEIEIEITRL